jgi:hypothetical protein
LLTFQRNRIARQTNPVEAVSADRHPFRQDAGAEDATDGCGVGALYDSLHVAAVPRQQRRGDQQRA